MNFRIVLFLLGLVFIQYSEAQLRCTNLFDVKMAGAQAIDQINDHHNKNILKKPLVEVLDLESVNRNIFQDFQARRQAVKLGRLLKKLRNAGEWDSYEYDQFAKKLTQLSFLTTRTSTKGLTATEKMFFQKAQQDALARGLENYFFAGTKAAPQVRRTVFDWFLWVIHDVRTRWISAPFYMPKLNGRVLDEVDAAKILWSGAENVPEVIAKYNMDWSAPIETGFHIFKTVPGKYYFNGFSRTYNWALVSAIFLGIPSYAYLSYTTMVQEGQAQATATLTPTLESSVIASRTDQHQQSVQRELDLYTEMVRFKKHRDPTEQEMQIALEIISNRGSKN